MQSARAALLAAAAIAAGCGRPLFAAQVDVPSIRIATAERPVWDPGSVVSTDFCELVPGCVLTTASYDLGAQIPFLDDDAYSIDVRLLAVAVHLAPAENLDGLEAMRFVLLDPGTGAPTVVASYAKPRQVDFPADVTVSGDTSVELGRFLRDGWIDGRVELVYDLGSPPGAFSAWVEAEFSAEVTVRYRAFL
jgi:hypothetical protein